MSAVANAEWATALVHGLSGPGGVRDFVISPGSRSTPLVLAVDSLAEVEIHVVLDERAAAFFALGVARASGRPVALVCTSGSAVANYLPAVVEASASGVPLIVLSADRPRELLGFGAGQTVAQVGMLDPHVRRSFDVEAPHEGVGAGWLRSLAAQALDAAIAGPAGAVHINVRFRKPLWDAGARRADGVGRARIVRGLPSLDAETIAALARRLEGVERGLIVAGPSWPGIDADAVHALSCVLDWPVAAEVTSQLRGRGAVVENLSLLVQDEALAQTLKPSLVLRLGRLPTATPVQQWLGGAQSISVDPHGQWHDPAHAVDTLFVAEPSALCRALVDALSPREATGWYSLWEAADKAAGAEVAAACEASNLLWEGGVARAVAGSLPSGAVLHVASSGPVRDLDAFAGALAEGARVMHSRGANGIDGTLATAFGEAVGFGDAVTCLLGDLAFRYDASSLALARAMSLDATVVVVDNGGGGIFSRLPIAQHPTAFDRYFLTPQPGSIADIARGYGAECIVVHGQDELTEALSEAACDDAGTLRVVCAVVDREASDVRRAAVRDQAVSAARVALASEGAA